MAGDPRFNLDINVFFHPYVPNDMIEYVGDAFPASLPKPGSIRSL